MGLFSRASKAIEFPEGTQWLNVTQPLTLADLQGRIVLLDFWTYCCINCMHVIPDLKALEERYPELVVIGVHSAKFHNEKVLTNIRNAVLRYELEHPVIADNDFALWSAYGIHAWPSFVLIDPAGNVVGRASGEGPFAMFDDAIASLTAAFDSQGLLEKEPLAKDLVRDKAPEAALSYPGNLTFDEAGDHVFLSDSNHNRIVVLTPEGQVTDVIGSGAVGTADGPYGEASFFRPQGLAHDPRGDSLYVADTENHLVRRVDLRTRTVVTVLGTGHQGGHSSRGRGTDRAINSPWDLTILGDNLFIAMAGPHQLWRMDLSSGKAEVFAGSGREDIVDGPATRAALAQPSGIDNDGHHIFFADSEVSAIRMVEGGEVRTLVGAGLFEFGDVDGPLRRARLQHPIGLTHHDGLLYVADTYNHKVRIVDPARGEVTTLAGTGEAGDLDGPAHEAQLSEPNDVEWVRGQFWIADTNNHRVRVYDPDTGEVSTLRLANEGALYPKTPSPSQPFRGRRIDLAPVGLPPGESVLHITLEPPLGHRWSGDAPNHIAIVGDEGVVVAPAYEPPAGIFDLHIPVEVAGLGEARVEAVVYYCEEGEREFCRFSVLELVVPVQVDDAGPREVDLEYQLGFE